MLSTGLLYAFGATLGWAIGAFPLTAAARQLPVASLNHLRLLLATIILFILSLLIEGEEFLSIFSGGYGAGWFWLGLSGVVALMVGDYFSFRSYAILGAQLGSVLTTLSPAAALFAGIILINEHVNYIGIIGMAITIVGVMSISLGRSQRNNIPDHGHGSVLKGILFGIVAACCHGSALAFSKKGFLEQAAVNETIDPLSASFIRIAAAMLLLFFVSMIMGKTKNAFQHIADSKPGIRNTIVGTIFNPVVSVTLSMIAILYMDVAVAQTIFSLVPLFSLIIAFVFYKEKITNRSIAGVIAALIGVALLIWRNKIAGLF
jgi:drug/metabolite transporter (DMT)-like permease